VEEISQKAVSGRAGHSIGAIEKVRFILLIEK
jgi:hypothetical protein